MVDDCQSDGFLFLDNLKQHHEWGLTMFLEVHEEFSQCCHWHLLVMTTWVVLLVHGLLLQQYYTTAFYSSSYYTTAL
jgi:hypothetical protein